MTINDIIEKLIEIKEMDCKKNRGIEHVATNKESREFLAILPDLLIKQGYSEKIVADVNEIAKYVPANTHAKINQLIEKLRTI